MDYLSPEKIAEKGAGYEPAEHVRMAVFRLWLEPNDSWARNVLFEYAGFRPLNSAWSKHDAWKTAYISIMMSRVAKYIYRYDRYKEPVRTFLIRNAYNARGDLLGTYARYRAAELGEDQIEELTEELAEELSPAEAEKLMKKLTELLAKKKKREEKAKKKAEQPPPTALALKRRLNKAARRLGVTPGALGALIDELEKLRGENEAADIRPMAGKLGVPPGALEAFLYNLVDDGGEGWQETPLSLDEIALEIGMRSELQPDWEIAAARRDEDGGGLDVRVDGSANKRYEDYLYSLSNDAPFGEWVGEAPNRQNEDGRARIAVQPLQMSREEIGEARRQLWDYRRKVELFREMLLK